MCVTGIGVIGIWVGIAEDWEEDGEDAREELEVFWHGERWQTMGRQRWVFEGRRGGPWIREQDEQVEEERTWRLDVATTRMETSTPYSGC